MDKEAITTQKAPRAIGPYSQAIKAGNFLYISGQVAIEANTNKFCGGTAAQQTEKVLRNIQEILDAAGLSLSQVVKTTVYLKKLSDFSEMNNIYSQFFKEPYPARVTIEVSNIPLGALIEIETIAIINP